MKPFKPINVRSTDCMFVIIADNNFVDKILLRKLAKRIKELRKIKNFTQDDLSFHSNIARSTLGNIETAQNDVVFSKLNRLAKAFDMTLAEFLNF